MLQRLSLIQDYLVSLDLKRKLSQRLRTESFLFDVSEMLRELNIQMYLYGGFIRDTFFSLESADLDLKVVGKDIHKKIDTVYELISTTYPKSKSTLLHFQSHPIIRYQQNLQSYDFSFIDEAEYLQGELNIDFTISGIFYDPIENALIDKSNGIRDLRLLRLRTYGETDENFKENVQHILRGIVLIVVFNFSPDSEFTAGVHTHETRLHSTLKKVLKLKNLKNDELKKLIKKCWTYDKEKFLRTLHELGLSMSTISLITQIAKSR